MTRTLKITIELTDRDTFDLGIYEPETGDFSQFHCHDNADLRTFEDIRIMDEIRSWVEIMREDEQ